MALDEDFVIKKLKKMKEKFPGLDVGQIERELYPLKGDDISPKTVKKKKEEDD